MWYPFYDEGCVIFVVVVCAFVDFETGTRDERGSLRGLRNCGGCIVWS